MYFLLLITDLLFQMENFVKQPKYQKHLPRLYKVVIFDDEFYIDLDQMGMFHEGGEILTGIYFKYINEYAEIEYEDFEQLFRQEYPWYAKDKKYSNWEEEEDVIERANQIFKKLFRTIPHYQPIDFIININKKEYKKLNERISLIKKRSVDTNQYDEIERESFKNALTRLRNFKVEFVDWFEKRNVNIPQVEHSKRNIDTIQLSEETLPIVELRKLIPQSTKWKNIVIKVKTDFTIEIKIGKKVFDINCSQTKYFKNKKTKKPNESWELLLELSYLGYFHPKDYTYTYLTKKPGKPKNRIYALGKALMNEFGISDKPFLKYNPSEGWYPLFKIENHRVSFHNRQRIKRKSETIPKIRDTYHSEDELNFEANRQEELERKGLSDSIDYSEKDGFEKEIEY